MTEGAYRCRGNCYLTERCSLTRTCLSNLLSVALFVEEAPPSALSTALFLPLTSTPVELLPPFALPSQCESVLVVLEPGSVVLVVLLPYFCPPIALALEWWWEVDPKLLTLWGLFFWEPAWLLSGSKSPQLDDLKWFFCRTSVSLAFDSFAGLWEPLTLPISPISLADRVTLPEGNTLPLVGAFVEVSGDGFDLVAETVLSLCRWSFFSDAMDATNNRITRRKPEKKDQRLLLQTWNGTRRTGIPGWGSMPSYHGNEQTFVVVSHWWCGSSVNVLSCRIYSRSDLISADPNRHECPLVQPLCPSGQLERRSLSGGGKLGMSDLATINGTWKRTLSQVPTTALFLVVWKTKINLWWRPGNEPTLIFESPSE